MGFLITAGYGNVRSSCLKRSPLELAADRQAARAFPGDDINDTGESTGTIETALRPAQDLDPLNVVRRYVGEIKLTIGCGVGLNAIDQHQYMIGFRSAHADLRQSAK